jgi:hypothetical protein
MSDRNKIAQALTVEQLDKFVRELAALPGSERNLEAIKAKAATLGIEISLMSATSFRDVTFKRHLDRLEKAQALATQVASMQQQGAGNTLADATAAMLSQQVFDLVDALGDDELDLKKAGSIAFILSKIRQGDVSARGLELKVKEYERKERERLEKIAALQKTIEKEVKKGGISAEARLLIDQELGVL